MPEQFPPDSYLESLSGVTDDRTEVYFPAKGEGLDWYVSFVKCVYRLVKNVSPVSALRVYKSGTLTFGIKSGSFFDGNTLRDYAGTVNQSLTDNASNYLFLSADATLQVNTTGFPDPAAVRHLRLAVITAHDGDFTDDDITDYRPAHLFELAGPVPNPAAGSVGPAQLADAIADLVPKITVAVGSESANTIQVTAQVRDAQDNANPATFLLHAWLSAAAYGPEVTTAPNGGVTVGVGATLETVTANKRWRVLTNTTGAARFDLVDSGTPTFYLNVELDGKVYASLPITFS